MWFVGSTGFGALNGSIMALNTTYSSDQLVFSNDSWGNGYRLGAYTSDATQTVSGSFEFIFYNTSKNSLFPSSGRPFAIDIDAGSESYSLYIDKLDNSTVEDGQSVFAAVTYDYNSGNDLPNNALTTDGIGLKERDIFAITDGTRYKVEFDVGFDEPMVEMSAVIYDLVTPNTEYSFFAQLNPYFAKAEDYAIKLWGHIDTGVTSVENLNIVIEELRGSVANVEETDVLQYGNTGNNSFEGFETGYTGVGGRDGVDAINYDLESENASFTLSSLSSSSTYCSKSGGSSSSTAGGTSYTGALATAANDSLVLLWWFLLLLVEDVQ